MKNKFLVPALVVLVAGTALWGGSLVHAQSVTTDSTQTPSIIQRLVQHFGLNQSDVQAVFNEDRAAHEADEQAREKTRLDQLVTDGKITAAQEQLIIDKRAEMEANKPTFDSSLTPEQRKAQMEAQRTDLQNWAQANGIDVQYLFGGFGGRGFGHHGMMGEMPMMGSTSSSAS